MTHEEMLEEASKREKAWEAVDKLYAENEIGRASCRERV